MTTPFEARCCRLGYYLVMIVGLREVQRNEERGSILVLPSTELDRVSSSRSDSPDDGEMTSTDDALIDTSYS